MIFSLEDFWGGLGVAQADFYLPDRRILESDGAGPIDPIQIGQRVWAGEVTITPNRLSAARAIDAKIEMMKEADGIFFVSPSERREGSDTGVLAEIDSADRRRVAFSDVTLAVGDYVSINNGTVYSLHQVAAVDSAIVVVPPIPLSISAGDVATNDTPVAKVRIGLDTRGLKFSRRISAAFSFSFWAVLT